MSVTSEVTGKASVYLTMSQSATAGNGGYGLTIGGAGGKSYSGVNFHQGLADPGSQANLHVTSIAYGGAGGNTGAGGKAGAGGRAQANTSVNGERTVRAFAVATSGAAGTTGGVAGAKSADAFATAFADLSGKNNASSASATAIATSPGDTAQQGFAQARADAIARNGQRAGANAIGTGSSGTATAVAVTEKITGLVSYVSGLAKAPVSSTASVVAVSNTGTPQTFFLGDNAQSHVFATAQPDPFYVGNALNANADVKVALGGVPASIFAFGFHGASYSLGATGLREYTNTATYVVDTTTLSGELVLGLLDVFSSGNDFTNVTLSVSLDTTSVFNQTFTTLASAQPFFDDTAIKLGVVPNKTNLHVFVTLKTSFDTSGGAFGANYMLGTTNGEIDVTPPGKPSTPDLTTASDTGGVATDNLTKNTTPTFTGSAEAAATVTLFADGVTIGTAKADAAGLWSITSTTKLGDGARVITAQAKDAVGNTSVLSDPLNIVIDATAPATPSAPDLKTTSDSGKSSADDITNVTTPVFTGKADANTLIDLRADGVSIGTITSDGTGAWEITSGVKLAEGARQITVTQTDLAGNVSTPSKALVVTIDTTPDAVPTGLDLATASDTGVSTTDNLTKLATPEITGKGQAGGTIELYDGATLVGTGVAQPDGA